MTNAPDEPPLPGFNVRSIGPEPSGATPLEEEDLRGLIPDFVATRADLNQVEFENITQALPWARRQALSLGAEGMLDYGFMLMLHRRMFGDVWRWAGTQRWRATNIGVEPHLIVTQSRLALDDAKFWHTQGVFGADELAARIHCRLVSIHPFPNGNGRATRMMADLYLASIGAAPFTWGGTNLDVDGSGRATYITALIKAADTDDHSDLIRFARGHTPAPPKASP
ncbi:MAG: mobile mystery protein B [Solirubrobacteraceae bacterium]